MAATQTGDYARAYEALQHTAEAGTKVGSAIGALLLAWSSGSTRPIAWSGRRSAVVRGPDPGRTAAHRALARSAGERQLRGDDRYPTGAAVRRDGHSVCPRRRGTRQPGQGGPREARAADRRP